MITLCPALLLMVAAAMLATAAAPTMLKASRAMHNPNDIWSKPVKSWGGEVFASTL
jgi:hypothetical protein